MAKLALTVVALFSAGSALYCVVCIFAGARRLRQRSATWSAGSANLPPISILKPLKGTDPEMYESLRSHCMQDYPEYEILFGITESQDPAKGVVEELRREFPNRAIRLVRCEKTLGANGKVSSLAQMVAIAKNDVLVVNDSDIRVESNYLRTISAELQQPGVGLITCLYRGVPADTIASRLESLGISSDFMAGVLVAQQLEGGLRFGLGSTLALRRRDLDAIGGFEAIVDYLADDYQLGRRLAERNLKVDLSRVVVETYLPGYDFSSFIAHQLRWARTIRTSRPAGYAGLPLTFTLPWAALAVLLARGAAWTFELFAFCCLLRLAMALITGRLVLRDRHLLRLFWLLPLRDFLVPFVWAAGLLGRKIIWRGQTFELNHGKLVRVG